LESYIIKIYRQENQGLEKAVGIAEHVITGKQTVFNNAEELWRIINLQGKSDCQQDVSSKQST